MGGSFEKFSALDNFERTGFVSGYENWDKSNFKALLNLVKSYVSLGISCPLTEDLASSACVCWSVIDDVNATAATLVYHNRHKNGFAKVQISKAKHVR